MEPVNSAIGTILQNGLLGALVIILGAIVVFKDKALTQEKLDRLKDWQNGNMTNIQALTEIRITLQRLLDLITQSGQKNG